MSEWTCQNNRILVIDDTVSIHEDFKKILSCNDSSADVLDAAADLIFGKTGDDLKKESGKPSVACDFVVESAMQGQEGVEKIRQAVASGEPYALAFVDMRMPPGWDGLKTIMAIWEVDPDIQIVICSAYSDQSWNDIIERLGVNDRLLILKKPFDPAEVSQLAVALTHKWELLKQSQLKMKDLEGQVESQLQQLKDMAYYDLLTGLPNRNGLTMKLEGMIEQGKPYSLCFLDFDRFKIVNDSLGHEAGDELLRKIAERMREFLNCEERFDETALEGPMAARLGGDEFVILYPGVTSEDIVSNKVVALLDALRPCYEIKSHQVCSTASIGITMSKYGYTTPEEVLRDADTAMYTAKRLGKNGHAFFNQDMHEELVKRFRLENDLRHTVEREELRLYYQPIVDLEHGAIAGFEALVRWEHPVQGLVPPLDFIPLAEETGLIVEMGYWILDEAIRQIKVWDEQYGESFKPYVNINVSKRQLMLPDFHRELLDRVVSAGLDVSRLRVEVTETSITDQSEVVIEKLRFLIDMGIGVAMDDFGTGESSLTLLHQFPISTLKIDRAFVSNLSSQRGYSAIVHAIIVLAKNMGMDIVAEGVETVEQLAQLQSLECDKAQGYLFAKPMPAQQIEAYLESYGIIQAKIAG